MAKIIFFSIGINVKDLFFLSDIDENLSYRRFKTHRLYDIPIIYILEYIEDIRKANRLVIDFVLKK